jgi:holliday junction DNA helicase RuvB
VVADRAKNTHNENTMIERSQEQLSPEEQPVVNTGATLEERDFEVALRPKKLEDFVGQPEIKEHLDIFIGAAKHREEPIEHVLLYGNPGLGKTTLAHIIANETGSQLRITSGPALERVGDLAAILSNLQEGDILFIDEIHRMNKSIEEVLYPAMEDFALDIIVGKGPTARTLRLNLERFTIIGATTRLSLLSAPLRDRFGVTHHLNFYEHEDIGQIVRCNAGKLEVEIHNTAADLLAERSRRTPRIANRLLRRVRDFAQVRAEGIINEGVAKDALKILNVDTLGLDDVDRRILRTIIEKFHGGPVGLSTIAAATQEEIQTIEEVHEPFLLQLGLLQRTSRGRIATQKAYDHLEIDDTAPTLL